MKGINIKNFCESLEHNGELEFEYENHLYDIQPNIIDNKHWLTIWKSISDIDGICLVKEEIFSNQAIEKEVIDKVLNAKCFNGKSFFEIYNDIEIISWAWSTCVLYKDEKKMS